MKFQAILFTVTVISFFFFSPVYAVNGEPLNAGFVSGIWYSKMPFFVGDQVRVYSAIHNHSGFDLIGKVKFFNGNFLIGGSDFSVVSGRVIEEWVDWKAVAGDHSLYVKIVDAKKSVVGKPLESVTLRFDSSGIDKQFVDFDTDGDGIGNRDDSDDDGDGVPDEIEIQQGTDPLKQDDEKPLQASGDLDERVVSKGTILGEASYDNDSEGAAGYDNIIFKTAGRVNNFIDSLKKKVVEKEIALRKEIRGTNAISNEGNPESPTQVDALSNEDSLESVNQADVFSSAIKKILGGENVAQNVHLAALSAVAFTLENQFIFYLIVSIVLFLALRFIVYFLRPKR